MGCNSSTDVSKPSDIPAHNPILDTQIVDPTAGVNARVLRRNTKQNINLGIHSGTVSFVHSSKNKSVGVSAGTGDQNIDGNSGKQRYMTNIAAQASQQNPQIPHHIPTAKQQPNKDVNMTKTKKIQNAKPNAIATQIDNENRAIPHLQESMIKITVESDLKEIPRTNTYRFTNSEIVLTEENVAESKTATKQGAMLHSTIIRKKCETVTQLSIIK